MLRHSCTFARSLTLAAVSALTASMLTACAPAHRGPTEADIVAMAINQPGEKEINERFAALPSLMHELCSRDSLSEYFAKTPCLPVQADRKMLTDSTRITAEQRKAMKAALAQIDSLNHETRRLMTESGIEGYVNLVKRAETNVDPLVRANQEKLLSGEITWGQYNRRRIDLSERYTAPIEALERAGTAYQGDGEPLPEVERN